MSFQNLVFGVVLFGLFSCSSARKRQAPLPIKCVIVTFFEKGEDKGDNPGEFQYWVENLNLNETLPFESGLRPLRYNAERGILALVAGVGNTRATAAIMALGLDARFDLTKAYWINAGIAGIDPHDAPLGSVAVAEWLIDGDLNHEIDAREIPHDWSTGYLPLRAKVPFSKPISNSDGLIYQLNRGLVQWAYQLTKNLKLTTTPAIQAFSNRYQNFPKVLAAPKILIGDQLSASTYWHGLYLNKWANDWVSYWTEGQGNFVTSAMEDTGVRHALLCLAKAQKVDSQRHLVLRSGSNFTCQFEGLTAAESLANQKLKGGGYTAYLPALENVGRVGKQIIDTLIENWAVYEHELPTYKPAN